MAPSKWRKVVQAVKEHTGKGLAKMIRNTNMPANASVSDLEGVIAKATRYEAADRSPLEERYVQEVLTMTGTSRRHINACVYFIAKRLKKTTSWGVVLKTLVLVHRLLRDGESGFEKEIFFANETHKMLSGLAGLMKHTSPTRRQAEEVAVFLNFAVHFGRYLDQRLEHGLRCRRDRDHDRDRDGQRIQASLEDDALTLFSSSQPQSKSQSRSPSPSPSPTQFLSPPASPIRDLELDFIYVRIERLLTLLDRVISCKPTGTARSCGLVASALGPVVVESHRIYYDIKKILNVLVERFMKLDTNECWIVHGLFKRISKQLENLDEFYTWCKAVEICGSTHEFPVIEKITQKKLDVMLRFIQDRSALALATTARRKMKKIKGSEANELCEEEEEVEVEVEKKIGGASDHLPSLIDFNDLEGETKEGEMAAFSSAPAVARDF